MIARAPTTQALFTVPSTFFKSQIRCLHRMMPAKRIPQPTPFVPDAATFLRLIGRKMSQHESKIPSWEALFSLSSQQLRESGVEPARNRRYLLQWRERFRNGEFGIGGDLTEVTDGVGELRIVEVPSQSTAPNRATLTSSPGMRKIVVNVPVGQDTPSVPLTQARPVGMVKIVRASIITGSKVESVKGAPDKVKIVAKEGLWEQRRGHKVDGGERRKAENRAKRRSAERKASRA